VGRLRFWLYGTALALPAVLFVASGWEHLRDGLALEASFPVPFALSLNHSLPKTAFKDAAVALRSSSAKDGNAQIWSAEARSQAGDKPQVIIQQVEAGLLESPASAEGWAFYAAMLEGSDPRKGALALAQAYTLAPNDYFWASERAILSSHLWYYLDGDTKAAALREARALWEEPSLRVDVPKLLATSNGGKLLTRAYASEPDVIREINRHVLAMRPDPRSLGP
jgi:hypothetical protein